MEKRIAVIVPAYNEEKTIRSVIWGIKDLGSAYEPVVVNDCSLDDTTGNAESAGATVIDLPANLGIGGAVQTGIKYALAAGFDACVQVDGDGQHPPSEIPKLVGPLFEDGVDIVVGSRFLGGAYKVPFMRSFGITVISLFLRATIGLKVQGRDERLQGDEQARNGILRPGVSTGLPRAGIAASGAPQAFRGGGGRGGNELQGARDIVDHAFPLRLLHGKGAPCDADRSFQAGLRRPEKMLHIRLFIGIISIVSFALTFEFIRKRHLREEYAILWLCTSSIIAVLSLWPGLIRRTEPDNGAILHNSGLGDRLCLYNSRAHALFYSHIQDERDQQGAYAEVRAS